MTSERPDAAEIIELLGLAALPGEGGYYRETFVSEATVATAAGPAGGPGDRRAGSAIYYLLTAESFSALHRLRSPEIFHFYLGDAVEMLLIPPHGDARQLRIGIDLRAGERPQLLVPAGVWQGSRVVDGGSWALLGTTMSPGYDAQDFELGAREALIAAFPHLRDEIARLTR
jgi:predicted cupin superfamily sugar epimerase